MDLALRCNIAACRKKLTTRAYITTCSHALCVDCANKAFSYALVCPLCQTSLSESTDLMLSDLNPSEEWKSLILSALRPEMVIEIAGRAASFWQYQLAQEQSIADISLRSINEKLTATEKHYSQQILAAKAESAAMKEKIVGLGKAYEAERKKTQELSDQLAEKTKQLKKMTLLCDKMKKRTPIVGNIGSNGGGSLSTVLASTSAINIGNGVDDEKENSQGWDALGFASTAIPESNLPQCSIGLAPKNFGWVGEERYDAGATPSLPLGTLPHQRRDVSGEQIFGSQNVMRNSAGLIRQRHVFSPRPIFPKQQSSN